MLYIQVVCVLAEKSSLLCRAEGGQKTWVSVSFAVESLLCQSGALFVPLCLNVLQSHPGSVPQ